MARAALAALALAGVGMLAFAGTGVASTTPPPAPAAQPAGIGITSIPPGYTRVSTGNLSAPAGTQARGSIGCPAGTVVFGGSVFTLSTNLLVNVNSTFPQRNGWTAFINNGSDAPVLYEITAICGTKPAHYKVVRAASVASRSGTQTAAHATCPSGAKPLSGGVLSSSPSPFVNVNSTYPQGQTWRVVETNASFDPAKVTAFTVCGKLTGYTVENDGFDFPLAPFSQGLASVTCPDSTLAIGGGVRTNSTSVAVTVNATWIDGRNWGDLINNFTAVAFTARPFAVCAGTLP